MQPNDRKRHITIWYVVIAIGLFFVFQFLWTSYTEVETISYSEFETLLDQGKISEVAVGENAIQGKLRQPTASGRSYFVTTRVDPSFADRLANKGITITGLNPNSWLGTLLSWVAPIGLFYLVWVYAIRRFADRQGLGGLTTIGKSRAKVYVETDTKVTFADVAGVDEAKGELEEVVAFLKDPKTYGRLGARAPKGILLLGPPGTGKTLLARAVAGEAGVPFFTISGSEFVELFVGVGAARVRDLFDQARQRAPAIIFIDELDALGRARGVPGIGTHDEKEQTLNQLLAELDGFDASKGVVLLAATNRPEILDPALLRAGRFDRQVLVDRPDKKGRVAILGIHLRKVLLAADVDAAEIAGLTAGFSGADLANLVNEAALLATRRGAESVAAADFTEAVERIVAGLEKRNRRLNEAERRVVAYHEMGHALVAMALPGTDAVHKVSIIPRGIGALGYTIQRPTEDRFLMTQQELDDKLTVLLAGRAAEHLVLGTLSTGAADDLAKATDVARSMVTRYGMNTELGHATYEAERPVFLGAPQVNPPASFSETTLGAIDSAVRGLVGGAFERARRLLERHRRVLESGAEQLLIHETLDRQELEALRARLNAAEDAAVTPVPAKGKASPAAAVP